MKFKTKYILVNSLICFISLSAMILNPSNINKNRMVLILDKQEYQIKHNNYYKLIVKDIHDNKIFNYNANIQEFKNNNINDLITVKISDINVELTVFNLFYIIIFTFTLFISSLLLTLTSFIQIKN